MPRAYVLHSRPYRETSALLELFTPEGRLRCVLRGARGKSGSQARPFLELDVELKGRGELKNAARLEPVPSPLFLLQGDALFSGLYLNELLVRLLAPADPHPMLYARYGRTLTALAAGGPLEPLLRSFEWGLLSELGYGFSLEQDVHGNPIEEQTRYWLDVENGLVPAVSTQQNTLPGNALLAMVAGHWQEPGTLQAAKRLMRQALEAHLGGRPLASRALFFKQP